jgi:hypothetical protein
MGYIGMIRLSLETLTGFERKHLAKNTPLSCNSLYSKELQESKITWFFSKSLSLARKLLINK